MGSWCYIVGQNIMTATAYEGGNSLHHSNQGGEKEKYNKYPGKI